MLPVYWPGIGNTTKGQPTNQKGLLMQTVTLSNGVTMNVPDGVGIVVSGGVPVPNPPTSTLDQVYFSEADLVSDCQTRQIINRVAIINTLGVARTVWVGVEPSIQFNAAPTGTLVMVSATNPPNPVPVPPNPSPTEPPYNQVMLVPWPATGQIRIRTSNLQQLQTAKFVTSVPANAWNPNPTHIGFMRVTEVGGSAVMPHYLAVYINRVLVVPFSGDGDSSPALNYTLGNPTNWQSTGAQFNVQPGDLLEVYMKNGYNATTQGSDVYYDFATPLRY